jgi:hypothetical protein
MAAVDFPLVFDALRNLLKPYETSLVIERDQEGDYSLNTSYTGPNKKPVWFGGVQIKKNYVSFHLMPVYIFPDLLEKITPALKKHMQGKSCFNFSKMDPRLFAELAELTQAGVERFREQKMVQAGKD